DKPPAYEGGRSSGQYACQIQDTGNVGPEDGRCFCNRLCHCNCVHIVFLPTASQAVPVAATTLPTIASPRCWTAITLSCGTRLRTRTRYIQKIVAPMRKICGRERTFDSLLAWENR